MRLVAVTAAILILLGLTFAGCSNDNPVQSWTDAASLNKKPVDPPPTGEGSFGLEAKYTAIGSYPTGGGVFILRLVPGADLTGDVALSISAHKTLNATLTTTMVNAETAIAEVAISPTAQAAVALHYITVTASNQTHEETIQLEVNVIPWGIVSMNTIQEKYGQFEDWLRDEHPELGNFASQKWELYSTYPRIVVVEHYTFLSDDWELRICFHVMIPPYDWSKMLLRPRGQWDPILAAIREWDEGAQDYVISEMPVEDYPIINGY